MYGDPDSVRSNVTKLSLTGEQQRKLDALHELIGAPKAVLARDLLVLGLAEVHRAYGIDDFSLLEVADDSLLGTA